MQSFPFPTFPGPYTDVIYILFLDVLVHSKKCTSEDICIHVSQPDTFPSLQVHISNCQITTLPYTGISHRHSKVNVSENKPSNIFPNLILLLHCLFAIVNLLCFISSTIIDSLIQTRNLWHPDFHKGLLILPFQYLLNPLFSFSTTYHIFFLFWYH